MSSEYRSIYDSSLAANGGITDFTEYRNNGRTFFEFTVAAAITIPVGGSINLFNSTDGIFSGNGSLIQQGDDWDAPSVIDNDFLRPNDYTETDVPYQDVETEIYTNIPVTIVGTTFREVKVEIRRRTQASPTVPVAIPHREYFRSLNQNTSVLSAGKIPTRSSGFSDNYYVYGYGVYIVNVSAASITIPAGGVIRVEIFNNYRRPVLLKPSTPVIDPPSPPVIDPPSPLSGITRVCFVGDSNSVTWQLVGATNPLIESDPKSVAVFNDAGATGITEVVSKSIPGITVLGATPNLAEAMSTHTGTDTLFIVNLGMNDANNTKPHSALSAAQRQNLIDHLAGLWQVVLDDGRTDQVIINNVWFADWDITGDGEPDVLNLNAPNNGTEPYNVEFWQPYIDGKWWQNNDGHPIVDAYGTQIQLIPHMNKDGIHVSPYGEYLKQRIFARQLLWALGYEASKPTPLTHSFYANQFTKPDTLLVNFGISGIYRNGVNNTEDGITSTDVRNKESIILHDKFRMPTGITMTFEHTSSRAADLINQFNDVYIDVDFDHTIESDPFYKDSLAFKAGLGFAVVLSGYTPNSTIDIRLMGYRVGGTIRTQFRDELLGGAYTEILSSDINQTPLSLTLTTDATGTAKLGCEPVNGTFGYLGGLELPAS